MKSNSNPANYRFCSITRVNPSSFWSSHSPMPSVTLNDLQDPSSSAYKKAKKLHAKTTRNRPEHADADWTPFRAAEKKYKARFPPPELSQVLDVAAGDPSREDEVNNSGWRGRPDAVPYRLLSPTDVIGKEIYTFPNIPGSKQIRSCKHSRG